MHAAMPHRKLLTRFISRMLAYLGAANLPSNSMGLGNSSGPNLEKPHPAAAAKVAMAIVAPGFIQVEAVLGLARPPLRLPFWLPPVVALRRNGEVAKARRPAWRHAPQPLRPDAVKEEVDGASGLAAALAKKVTDMQGNLRGNPT
jgi:hypothetical protein